MIDRKLILEAISLKHCIEATYNRVRMKLAPHILYTRHGDLFLDAVAIEREGQAPTELKIGTFKVAGLQDGVLTQTTFQSFPGFEPNVPKYLETTPFAIASR